MTVKVRQCVKSKHAGLEADIRFRWLDGTWFRRRFRAPVNTENQAQRWGEDLERRLYAQGKGGALGQSRRDPAVPGAPEEKEVTTTEIPSLDKFWPRFIKGHCEANRHKPSGIERKESAYRTGLKPGLGAKRLDDISAANIATLKGDLAHLSARSANNVLTALSACLRFPARCSTSSRTRPRRSSVSLSGSIARPRARHVRRCPEQVPSDRKRKRLRSEVRRPLAMHDGASGIGRTIDQPSANRSVGVFAKPGNWTESWDGWLGTSDPFPTQ